MKKLLTILSAFFLLSFTAGEKEKTLTATGDIQAWQALIDCIENSNEPHVKVEAVKKWILPQLQKQLSDTTK
jgi:hypothetical protein